jgi:hypothetical protein
MKRKRCSLCRLVLWAALFAAGCGNGGPEETDASEDIVPADADALEDAPADADAADDAGTDADADADADAADVVPDTVAPGLVQFSDFELVGAFRVPADTFGISEMNFSQGPLEYDPENRTILIVGHTYQQAVAEFQVPELVLSDRLEDLNMSPDPVQTFASVIDRVSGGNPQALDRIGGMKLVPGPSGRQLLVHVYEYYDAPADNTQTTCVMRDPSDLAGSAVDGFFSLQGAAHSAGWMSPIPDEWQTRLGGPMISGSSSGMPIISRLSVGPSAFVFDPQDVVDASTPGESVAATTLLDYDLENPLHDDLMNETGGNDIWTHLSRAVYGFIVPGTHSYVTLGHSGGHAETGVCYKCTPIGETADCGGYCSVDPDDYDTFYWFYDVEDLEAVREGDLQPWEVRPYAYGPFTPPFPTTELGGGAYDADSGLLYITLQRADTEQGTYANPPVIAVYRINLPG